MAQTELFIRSEHLENAWQQFMTHGVINQETLRPIIARSWHRCVKQKGDDSHEPLPLQILQAKRTANQLLMDAAQPVINDLVTMMQKTMNCFSVMIADSEGDIIDGINTALTVNPIGQRCSEIHSGTTATGLALIDGVSVEVSGYEHLQPLAHNWHTIAVPIRGSENGIVGVLCLLSTEGPCLPLTMQVVSLGAQLIENRFKQNQSLVTISSSLVEDTTEAAVLANQSGIIMAANQAFIDLFQLSTGMVIGQPLMRFLAGNHESKKLFTPSSRLDNLYQLVEPYKQDHSYWCRVNRFMVGQMTIDPLILFTFRIVRNSTPKPLIPESNVNDPFTTLIGASPSFYTVIRQARLAAATISTVLLEGESGTGKELLAGAIHTASKRRGRFVAINCGAIPRELMNSELFGFEEGAFTGARKGGNPGKIEIADGGTLFLDEIGEMPLDMQVSLLRFLEDKIVMRIGSHHSKVVDVRIIAATNRNLLSEVEQGTFRRDLYYRLNVVNLHIPSLAQRKKDIPLLAHYLLERLCESRGLRQHEMDESVLPVLCAHSWPGNVRELQNVIESSLIMAGGETITPDCLPPYLTERMFETTVPVKRNLKDFEKSVIIDTLKRYDYNISKTAKSLGISRTTLYSKMEQMGIKRS